MMLHHEQDLFERAIMGASQEFHIEAAIVEKDYYVTEFLREISTKQPDVIFKGGTSLSKCYKLIRRFSEDVDLNLEGDTRPTEGQRRRLKDNIISALSALGLTLINPDDVRSRRDFNRYLAEYPIMMPQVGSIKPRLEVETAVFLRAYPTQRLPATSFVYDYLERIGRQDLVVQYGLGPFELNVQSKERTFVDKLFALADYYLDDKLTEHSRHLYDIAKLSEVVALDDDFRALVHSVRLDRQGDTGCPSAKEDVDTNGLLQTIIDEGVYRADYKEITEPLLFEEYDYEAAVEKLQKVIDALVL